jgi:hypothetical protein
MDTGTVELWRLSNAELREELTAAQRGASLSQARLLQVIEACRERGLPGEDAALSTRQWVGKQLNLSAYEAGVQVRMARAFAEELADTGAALAAGEITGEHARTIHDMVTQLPKCRTAEDVEFAQATLLEAARAVNAKDLRQLRRCLAEAIDPDGEEPRDDDAQDKRAFDFRNNHDGTHTVKWTMPDEWMAATKVAVHALAAPAPAADGSHDLRSASQRRADAMADLIARALRFGDLPTTRGTRQQLTVILRGQRGAVTGTGERLSAAAARRLACDCDLTVVVEDDWGQPLNVGRTSRTVTPAIWAALMARDTGCAFPGCTRPAAWCQAHHIVHWCDHGETSVENCVLLCDAHHDTVHHKDWIVRLDEHGIPEFIPPPKIDPEQRPRRNEHWRARRGLDFIPLTD